MKNEFELIVTLQLECGGTFKTFRSGDPSLKPEINDLAEFTDSFVNKICRENPEFRLFSINYLPHMLYRV